MTVVKVKFDNPIGAERFMAKVSRMELANALEVAPATIAKWEKDIDKAPIGKIKQMAEYFNCDIDYLIGVSKERRKEG